VARLEGFESPTYGLEDRTSEFPNLLKTLEAYETIEFLAWSIFADFGRYSQFLQILESFSHTDSHTAYPPSSCPHQDPNPDISKSFFKKNVPITVENFPFFTVSVNWSLTPP